MTSWNWSIPKPSSAFFTDALPDRAKILAVPLANTVEGYVHDRVLAFMETDLFHRLWVSASGEAHARAIRLIEDRSPNVTTDDEKVTINLIPLVNGALEHLGEASPELLGKSVDLPTLTVDDLPAAARIKIQRALNRPVSSTFGQIEVYDRGSLAAVQTGVSHIEDLWAVSIVALLISAPLALWLSRRRRRTLLQLLLGVAFGLILVRRSAFIAQEHVIGLFTDPTTRSAVEASTAVFVDPLVSVAGWIVAGLAVAMAIVVLTGPYPWAVALRRRVVHAAQALGRAFGDHDDSGTATWVRSHQEEALIGGAVVAGLAVWTLSMNWWILLTIALLLGAYSAAIRHIAKPRIDDRPS